MSDSNHELIQSRITESRAKQSRVSIPSVEGVNSNPDIGLAPITIRQDINTYQIVSSDMPFTLPLSCLERVVTAVFLTTGEVYMACAFKRVLESRRDRRIDLADFIDPMKSIVN